MDTKTIYPTKGITSNYYTDVEIRWNLDKHGYLDVDGVGRLRPHTVSRGVLVAITILALITMALFYGASNLRVAVWQAQAVRAQIHAAALEHELVQAQTDQSQLAACMTTVETYRATLAQVEKDTQAQAPTNPQAANWLRLISLLKMAL